MVGEYEVGTPHPALRGSVLRYIGRAERSATPWRRVQPAAVAAPSLRGRSLGRMSFHPTLRYADARAAIDWLAAELSDTDYGSRDFSVRDPEGNLWSFGTYGPASG